MTFGLYRTCEAAGEKAPADQSLTVIPLIQSATLGNGYGSVPFRVTNTYTKAVSIVSSVRLKTTDDSGKKVSAEEYRKGFPMGDGPELRPTILQPGQTGTFNSTCSIETFAFLRDRNKKVFGELFAQVVATKERIGPYFSEPFAVPDSLASTPWTELGEQKYFVVTSDTNNIVINPHKLYKGVWLNGSVTVPVSIKNTSNQSLIAVESPSIYLVSNGKNPNPSHWTAVKVTTPVLKPGESIATQCEIDLGSLESGRYKPDDLLAVIVEGHIPNTNQVFESYSAPFELPPLPKEKQPKGAVQIPGM